jgi:hypothetical protein
LFASATTDLHEFHEVCGQSQALAQLDRALRDELAGFSDEELTTVDLFFGGRKP